MAVGTHVGRVYHEVVTIDIIYISVSVVVNARFSVELSLVYHHVLLEVGVVILETTVDDGHEHVALSCLSLPSFPHIGVGSCHTSRQ